MEPFFITSGELKKSGISHWLLLFVLVLIWGSSFILMKRGLDSFASAQVAAIRIMLTSIVLMPVAFMRIKRITLKEFGLITLTGITGNGIPAFLFTYAQTGIDSSTAGILNSLTPLSTMVLGLIFFKYKMKWYNAAGVFIGLAGTAGLLSMSGGKDFVFNFHYGVFILLATILYALNLNIIKRYLKSTDSLTIASFAFFAIGPFATIYLFGFTPFVSVIMSGTAAVVSFGYIAILAIVGTALATVLYNMMIKRTNVVFAASVTYLMPVVSLMWGIGDGEVFEVVYLVWIFLILFGVYLVNKKQDKLKIQSEN
jgi:drug/metabolite transporter (DMT)-like permease